MEHSSDILFSIGPVEITGVLATMWVIIALLALLSWLATRNMKDVPGVLQNLAEMSVSKLQSYFEGVMGKKLAKKYFPLMATFFIFIIVCNYSGLLPGAASQRLLRAYGKPVRHGSSGHNRLLYHPHRGI
ncbi:MAG: F0F1 ATP synthase subunit A [Oscillospiraceae bacterium]